MEPKEIQAPVTAVTLYPNGVKILRSAVVRLEAGEGTLVLPSLPPGLGEDSLRLGLPGAKILDLSVEDRYFRTASEDFTQLDLRRRELERALVETTRKIQILDQEFLMFLRRPPLMELLDEENPKLIQSAYWQEYLDALNARLEQGRLQARSEYLEYFQLREELQVLGTQLEKIKSQESTLDRRCTIAYQAPQALDTTLEITYFQDQASWSPAYNLRAFPQEGILEVEFFALVNQQTGQAWDRVTLELSTIRPTLDCRVPELAGLRLREQPPEEMIMYEPLAMEDQGADYFKEEEEREKSVARSVARHEAPMPKKKVASALRTGGAGGPQASFSAPTPPPSPSPQAVFAGPPPGAPPPKPRADQNISEESLDQEPGAWGKVPVAMGKYHRLWAKLHTWQAPGIPQAQRYTRAGAFAAPRPIQNPGGYEIRYPVGPLPRTLASDTQNQQVLAGVFRLPMELTWVCVPAQQERVFLRARVRNQGTPLLPGPAQVFLEGDLVTPLDFPGWASGQVQEISLGVDQNFTVRRREEIRTKTQGLGFKDQITETSVTLEIISALPGPTPLEIWEAIPTNPDTKGPQVTGFTASQNPQHESSEGILVWKPTLTPGQKFTLTFSYSIKIKEDQRLVLRTSSQVHSGLWKGERP